ncbi:hypothetical protein [Burkholderia gladioli]|uniref:hypothetical protein n=1 Tax=Burkholderia gladioli TaxID=28095 RepID=UPI00163ED8D9|nr:hypothetical protein [Burkholderia gladioli]
MAPPIGDTIRKEAAMKTIIVENYSLDWSSIPFEYDYLTLEIRLGIDPVAVVNREHGLDNLEVELYGPIPNGTMRYKIPLDRLIDALIECRDSMKGAKWRDMSSDDHIN